MVNLELREIQLGGKVYPITSFEVWWFLPGKGLFRDMDEAVNQKNGNVVVPTPVAVAKCKCCEKGIDIYEVIPSEVA